MERVVKGLIEETKASSDADWNIVNEDSGFTDWEVVTPIRESSHKLSNREATRRRRAQQSVNNHVSTPEEEAYKYKKLTSECFAVIFNTIAANNSGSSLKAMLREWLYNKISNDRDIASMTGVTVDMLKELDEQVGQQRSPPEMKRNLVHKYYLD